MLSWSRAFLLVAMALSSAGCTAVAMKVVDEVDATVSKLSQSDCQGPQSGCIYNLQGDGEHHLMIKFLSGVCLTLFTVSYGSEIKQFVVTSGMRDQLVTYLQSF